MASTYQLLAHARLIGLGKRFDRFLNSAVVGRPMMPLVMPTAVGVGVVEENRGDSGGVVSASGGGDGSVGGSGSGVGVSNSTPSSRRSLFKNNSNSNDDDGKEAEKGNKKDKNQDTNNTKKDTNIKQQPQPQPKQPHIPQQPQLKQQQQQQHISKAQAAALARILPNDVNLDNTMMEHLAHAAMELHYKRTGRGNKHHQQQMQLQQQQQMGGVVGATIATDGSGGTGEGGAGSNIPVIAIAGSGGGVAWTVEEKEKCREAAEKYGRDDVDNITKAVVGRTEAEVRAHFRNVDGRKRVERDLGVKKDDQGGQHSGSAVGAGTGSGNGIGSGIPNAGSTNGRKEVKKCGGGSGGTEVVSPNKTPRRSGARTKKPPTKAMLTVSDVTFDAKKILSGSFL